MRERFRINKAFAQFLRHAYGAGNPTHDCTKVSILREPHSITETKTLK